MTDYEDVQRLDLAIAIYKRVVAGVRLSVPPSEMIHAIVKLVAAQASPPTTPQRELVGEVIRGVRDRLTSSGEVEDYDRGVCDACNDSLELLYTGKLTSQVSPPTPDADL